MVRKAGARAGSVKWRIGAACALAAILALSGAAIFGLSGDAKSRRVKQHGAQHHNPAASKPATVSPVPAAQGSPMEIPSSQYEPVGWSDVPGWAEDDLLKAFATFRISCAPIMAPRSPPAEARFIGTSLREPCRAARRATVDDSAAARVFFEKHFRPLLISRLGEAEGFVTGYYEPVVEGSRDPSDVYNVPVYRRPSNLFVRGFSQSAQSLPNKGDVFRKIGRRKLVPYYDRAQIEDGAIAGRGLEIVWLKSQTDLLFVQIQGSARVKLADGSLVRINYAAHNGYPYTPVGRILIERNIVPREQMSMQRIRQYMEENPGAAAELRRQNRAYVFFREVSLGEQEEAVGAQGVPLTPGRSIAVDKALHVYGTPFFIDAELPTGSDRGKTSFRRLMVAQDTGSAIVGPARADIYFGAGGEAGRIAGRIKDTARFVMLLPKALDPLAQGRTMPLPAARPSAKIARLFPQSEQSGEKPHGGHQEQLKEPLRRQPKKGAVPMTEAQALSGQALSEQARSEVLPVQTPSARAEPVSEQASPRSAPLPVARPRNAPAPKSPADTERERP